MAASTKFQWVISRKRHGVWLSFFVCVHLSHTQSFWWSFIKIWGGHLGTFLKTGWFDTEWPICKLISQVSKKIRQPACAFNMALQCYVIYFYAVRNTPDGGLYFYRRRSRAVSTRRLTCLFQLLVLWNRNRKVSTKWAMKLGPARFVNEFVHSH